MFDGKPCKWRIIMKPFFFTQPKYFVADVLSILSVGPWFCSFNIVLAIAFHFQLSCFSRIILLTLVSCTQSCTSIQRIFFL